MVTQRQPGSVERISRTEYLPSSYYLVPALKPQESSSVAWLCSLSPPASARLRVRD